VRITSGFGGGDVSQGMYMSKITLEKIENAL
jgi:hypothetical protein